MFFFFEFWTRNVNPDFGKISKLDCNLFSKWNQNSFDGLPRDPRRRGAFLCYLANLVESYLNTKASRNPRRNGKRIRTFNVRGCKFAKFLFLGVGEKALLCLPFFLVPMPSRDEEPLVVITGGQGKNEPVVEPRAGGVAVHGRPVESAAFARRNQRRLSTTTATTTQF